MNENTNNEDKRVVTYTLKGTNFTFNGRKMAKIILGAGRFRRYLRDGKILFN